MNRLVSIVIPVYKTEATLNRCIESAIAQTYKNIEIILVDDNSPDNSGIICDDYSSKYERIKVIHKKENEGLLLARKTGVSAARGYYILNVDSDDYIETNMVETMIGEDKNNNSDIITAGFVKEYNDGSTINLCDSISEGWYDLSEGEITYETIFFNGSFLNNGILPNIWCKLIRREILIKVYEKIKIRLNIQEDVLATYGSIGLADSICVTKKNLYHYCISNNSMSRNTNENYFIDISNVYKTLKNLFNMTEKKDILIRQLDLYMMYSTYAGMCEYFGLKEEIVPPYFTFDTSIIPMDSRIILYGAGRTGKSYYKVCKKHDINIVLWVDKNLNTYIDNNFDVSPVEKIKNIQYDYILIAMKSKTASETIKNQLISEYEVLKEKIICPKTQFELDKYVNWG